MRARSRWLSVVITALVITSMAAMTFVSVAKAAPSGKTAHKGPGACATQKKVKPKGEIRYSDWQFPPTLNTNMTSMAAANLTIELMQDPLGRYDQHAVYTPILLAKIPTVKNGGITNGGKTITLVLKPNRHWANGAAVTSHQIWFAWKVGMDPLSGPVCKGTCDKIASISTPNKYTAVLHMKQVYAWAIPRALPGIEIEQFRNSVDGWDKNNYHQAANALYQDKSFNFTNKDYPTNGPYQVSEYTTNERIVLTPNPKYDNMTCGAKLARVTFAWYSAPETMIAAAASRDTDITQDYHPVYLSLINQHKSAYKVWDTPGFTYEHMELNVDPTYNDKPNPLSNRNVRVALALAFHKAAILKSALGVSAKTAKSIQAYNLWINRPGLHQLYSAPQITGQYDPVAKKYVEAGSPQAIKDAKKLLAATQWKNGFTLDAFTTTLAVRLAVLNAIAKDWQTNLGVKMTVTGQPAGVLFGNWEQNGTCDRGKFQICEFAWLGNPVPDLWLNVIGSKYVDRKQPVHADSNQNYAGFQDPIIDKAFKIGAATYNTKVQRQVYQGLQVEMNKQAYWVGLYYRDAIATSDSKVKGFLNNPTSAGVSWNGFAWST